MEYRIKPGAGFWDTTRYPIGGKFDRAGALGLKVNVVRTFKRSQSSHGTDAEGITLDGRTIAFDTAEAVEIVKE
jgi:hypothetical protein